MAVMWPWRRRDGKPITEVPPKPIADVIAQVKQAIGAADLDKSHIVVTKLDLTLKVVHGLTAGVDAKWMVPVVGSDLGVTASDSWSATNVIAVHLKPRPPQPSEAGELMLGWAFVRPSIPQELTAAIEMINTALEGTQDFNLQGASIMLSFGVTKDGSLSLVASGKLSDATTHTLTVTFGPRPASSDHGVTPVGQPAVVPVSELPDADRQPLQRGP